MNAIDILAELKKAGVAALKIEGRQRSRAYVSEVVSAFRKAVDALEQGERATSDLSSLSEGKKQTTGAYKKGWR
jgi:putative protease